MVVETKHRHWHGELSAPLSVYLFSNSRGANSHLSLAMWPILMCPSYLGLLSGVRNSTSVTFESNITTNLTHNYLCDVCNLDLLSESKVLRHFWTVFRFQLTSLCLWLGNRVHVFFFGVSFYQIEIVLCGSAISIDSVRHARHFWEVFINFLRALLVWLNSFFNFSLL